MKLLLALMTLSSPAHAQVEELILSETITPPAYNSGPATDLGPNGRKMLIKEAMDHPAMVRAKNRGRTIQLEQVYNVFADSKYPTRVHRVQILYKGLYYGEEKDKDCIVTILQETSLSDTGKIYSTLTHHYEIPRCYWGGNRKKGFKETALALNPAPITTNPIVIKADLPTIRTMVVPPPAPKTPKPVSKLITVYGVVKTTEGQPIAGFAIEVPGGLGLTATTNEKGEYRIEDAPRTSSEVNAKGQYNGFNNSLSEEIVSSDIVDDEVEKNFVIRDREKEINAIYDAKLAELKNELAATLPTPPPPPPVSVFGVPTEPVIAFLLDNSHTMDSVRGIAIESVKSSLRALKPSQKFVVGLAAEVDSYHFNNGIALDATRENVEAACAFLDVYHPDVGGERFWQSFEKYKAANPSLRAIYIFTDGLFHKTLQIPRLLDFAENGGIPIIVRAMADADINLLSKVAKLSNGRLISGEFSNESYQLSPEQQEAIRKYEDAMREYNASAAAKETELERQRQVALLTAKQGR